jgi:hypothetical protein
MVHDWFVHKRRAWMTASIFRSHLATTGPTAGCVPHSVVDPAPAGSTGLPPMSIPTVTGGCLQIHGSTAEIAPKCGRVKAAS